MPALLSPVPAQDCGSSLPPALQHNRLGFFFSFEIGIAWKEIKSPGRSWGNKSVWILFLVPVSAGRV